MFAELLVAVVVVALDGGFLDGAVDAFDLAVGPGVIGPGEAVRDALLGADLGETKNGAVLRKWLGYQFLPSAATAQIHAFYRDWLNPYLNFHRPCAFASWQPDRSGKPRKVYRLWQTPYEALLALPWAIDRSPPAPPRGCRAPRSPLFQPLPHCLCPQLPNPCLQDHSSTGIEAGRPRRVPLRGLPAKAVRN